MAIALSEINGYSFRIISGESTRSAPLSDRQNPFSILLLAPVFKKNAMVMESLGDAAAATYVFRLPESVRIDPAQWRRFLLEFNDSMLSVNFRREPIYLSDEALEEARYETYKNALRRVPALTKLRSLFAGRAVHSGFDAWKKKIESLMR